jgi:uncharacterized GH25 family protein
MAPTSLLRIPRAVLLGALTLLVAQAPLAAAHEFWLAPTEYVARPGDTVRVLAFSGMGFQGEPRRYARERVVRFVATDVEQTDLTGRGADSDSIFASLVARDAGGVMIAYESNAASIALPNAEFDRYVEDDGLEVPRVLRLKSAVGDSPQRERYARCAKTWVSGRSWRRACAVTDLTLELVPLANPAQKKPLSFRVLFRGRPLAGGLVRAWRQPLDPGVPVRRRAVRDSVGAVTQARSDAHGLVRLPITAEGEWLISCVHMVQSDNLAQSDWQSWWASLTFVRSPSFERRR